MFYHFVLLLIRLIVRMTTQLEVYGAENVPPHGAYVIVSNHLGRLDPVLVYYFINRKDIIMLVAEKYRRNPLLRWFFGQLDGIFIDRYGADFVALREALKRLRKGGVLTMAPEGTRSRTAALIEARPGASYLAAKAGVPIIPVAVTGTEDALVMANLKRLRKSRVTIRAGKPFTLPPIRGNDREEVLEQYTEEIMCRIGALLPPAYRGFYADHPRLKELLEDAENEK